MILVLLLLSVSYQSAHADMLVCGEGNWADLQCNSPAMRLRVRVRDEHFSSVMGDVFAMSDGSNLVTSPYERRVPCANTTACLHDGEILAPATVEYMNHMLRWIDISYDPDTDTLTMPVDSVSLSRLVMWALAGKLISGDHQTQVSTDDVIGGLQEMARVVMEQHTGRLIITESKWKTRTRVMETLLIVSIVTIISLISSKFMVQQPAA